jgi:hypothetical protein
VELSGFLQSSGHHVNPGKTTQDGPVSLTTQPARFLKLATNVPVFKRIR